jgi:hypothetical protein
VARIHRVSDDPTVQEIPLAFVDTETTHVRNPFLPGGRRPWEVAVRRRDPDGRIRRFGAIIEDVDLTGADPQSLEIGGFYQRHPRHGGWMGTFGSALMPEVDVAHHLADVLAGAQLVALNVGFDALNFSWLLSKRGLEDETWDYHSFDLGTATSLLLGWRPPYSGSGLAKRLGVLPEAFGKAHIAPSDAAWHEGWYDALWRLPIPRETILAALAA